MKIYKISLLIILTKSVINLSKVFNDENLDLYFSNYSFIVSKHGASTGFQKTIEIRVGTHFFSHITVCLFTRAK